MRTRLPLALTTLGLAALLLSTPALAGQDEGPTVGPLSLHADTSGMTQVGFLGLKTIDMEFTVYNTSTETGLKAVIQDPVITFSDGSQMRLRKIYHGPFSEQLNLDPDSGRIDFPLVVIPEDAPSGPAIVELRGHIANVFETGPDAPVRHSDWAPGNHALAIGVFLVTD